MQHYVDNRLTTDVEIIEANSPDVLTDLGILMHVMVKRHWRNPGKGWTDVPVDWLAGASRMGFRRVKESCDRLVALGILQPSKLNNIPGHVTMYQYNLRAVKEEVYDELTEAKEVEKEEVVEVEFVEGVQLEHDQQGPHGTAYAFDNKTWTMQPIKVTPEELLSFPQCHNCGRVFHPTQGRGRTEHECAYCALKTQLRILHHRGNKELIIKSPYGERTFTRAEAEKMLGI